MNIWVTRNAESRFFELPKDWEDVEKFEALFDDGEIVIKFKGETEARKIKESGNVGLGFQEDDDDKKIRVFDCDATGVDINGELKLPE
jgi:hypothetical protein